MTIQAINSASNVNFQGRTKKTPRGNEYQVSNASRSTGAAVGLLSGAFAAKMAANTLKTNNGKRMFIQSLHNMNKDFNVLGPKGTKTSILNVLGPKGARTSIVSNGVKVLALGISALGMFVGAAIGGTIDSHNNQKRAKEADKIAKANP